MFGFFGIWAFSCFSMNFNSMKIYLWRTCIRFNACEIQLVYLQEQMSLCIIDKLRMITNFNRWNAGICFMWFYLALLFILRQRWWKGTMEKYTANEMSEGKKDNIIKTRNVKKRTSKMSMQRIHRDPSIESYFNMGGDVYIEQCVPVYALNTLQPSVLPYSRWLVCTSRCEGENQRVNGNVIHT